ncbi:MAG TPA: hypothetical protein VMF63_03355 [Opitutaceae bacterium]|nr:hypothetical protein [Opitutaceae bacterium]
MDWILEHLQVLIVIAAAVFAILQKFKIVRTPGTNAPAAEEDPEQAERTRRVQEEIRRRILERRGTAPGVPPEPEVEAAPIPAPPPIIEAVRPMVVAPPEAPAEEQREWERQQALLQRLQELEAAPPARPGSESTPAAATAVGMAAPTAAGSLIADLRNQAGLRRAVVLREILGPPVGLR